MSLKYGILAYPAKHSLSPVMHNAAFKALGIQAKYGIFELQEDYLEEFFREVKNLPIDGLSVSLPYKEKCIEFLDEISEDAAKIGAVNTVINREGFLYGDNTDYIGAVEALKEQAGRLKDAKVILIGAGGSARAVAYGLLKEGAHVMMLNRTKTKAVQIAMEFAEMFKAEIYAEDLDKLEEGDILINTSSIWHTENLDDMVLPAFCNPVYVSKFNLVMDIAYKPLITPLIEAADMAHVSYITGDRMLLYQAAAQFELWTGEKAPMGVMQAELKKALRV